MKVYGIYEYHYANEEGRQIAVVSSKIKAVGYVRACIANTDKFSAVKITKNWYEKDWCYSEEIALNAHNILKYRYIGKEHGYYVKEIEVL